MDADVVPGIVEGRIVSVAHVAAQTSSPTGAERFAVATSSFPSRLKSPVAVQVGGAATAVCAPTFGSGSANTETTTTNKSTQFSLTRVTHHPLDAATATGCRGELVQKASSGGVGKGRPSPIGYAVCYRSDMARPVDDTRLPH
jgi:hypothetical protein